MSSFCGANIMQNPFGRNPFGTPVQTKSHNAFSGSFNQQPNRNQPEKNSPIQFGREGNKNSAVTSNLKYSQPQAWITEIWHLHTAEFEPANLWENARVEFLAKIRPQQKADRAIAIGLNQSLKKSADAGQNCPAPKPFLNSLAMNDKHSLAPSGGLGPHFLA